MIRESFSSHYWNDNDVSAPLYIILSKYKMSVFHNISCSYLINNDIDTEYHKMELIQSIFCMKHQIANTTLEDSLEKH